jgi:hypothetical protein
MDEEGKLGVIPFRFVVYFSAAATIEQCSGIGGVCCFLVYKS